MITVTTSSTVTTTDSTARLLAMFGGRLSIADGMEPGRISSFQRIAQHYGRFLHSGPDEPLTNLIATLGTSAHAIGLYRDATEEQRLAVDDLMEKYPNEDTYCALMEALLRDSKGTTQNMFDMMVSFYPAISDIAGRWGTRCAFRTLAGLDESVLKLLGREMESCRAVVGMTSMCAASIGKSNLSRYLFEPTEAFTINRPTIHVGGGIMKALLPEHAEIVAAHPDKATVIATAMKASHRMLDAQECETVATGDQPLPLVEGML